MAASVWAPPVSKAGVDQPRPRSIGEAYPGKQAFAPVVSGQSGAILNRQVDIGHGSRVLVFPEPVARVKARPGAQRELVRQFAVITRIDADMGVRTSRSSIASMRKLRPMRMSSEAMVWPDSR